MNESESSLETAVRELESITGEIARLRDAVSSHRDAALGLESVASSLADLTKELSILPGKVQSQFSGLPQLVSSIEASLQPAGTLEIAINELVDNSKVQLQQLQSEHDSIRSEMQEIQKELASLRSLSTEHHESTVTILRELSRRQSEQFEVQESNTSAIKDRLAKLTGLARRGFIAMLRGKDAPPAPF